MTVALLPATVAHLEAFQRDPAELAALLGSSLPDGWPEFPEAIEFTRSRLVEHPDEAEWWMHFFVDPDGRVVGSGGFAGPPADRRVELGYEIAPAFRGLGHGTAAAGALRDKAIASGEVDSVIAHTLAVESPSTAVLARLGFERIETVTDPDEGELWRWEWRAAD